jgi:sugar lactone lactonase YvrE
MLPLINRLLPLLFITWVASTFAGCHKTPNNNPSSNPPPAITSFAPLQGNVGTLVVITGTNFSAVIAGNAVKFNGVTATVTAASTTQLSVTVPAGTANGKITVTTNGQTATSATDFTVLFPAPTPTIIGFAPGIGWPGDTVLITGTNFSTTTSNDIVRFNGVAAAVTNATSTQLTVIIPPGANNGTISVTINGQAMAFTTVFTIVDSQVSTFAGNATAGLLDDVGIAAQFHNPAGIAIDASGNLFIADLANRSIRKITPAGVVSTIVTFSNPSSAPSGVTVDVSGNIYVADRGINMIEKISSSGVVSELAAAQVSSPSDLAVDASGNVFVLDADNRRIRKVTQAGIVTTFAGSDTSQSYDGIGLASTFTAAYGITIDPAGNLYVGDLCRIRKITPLAVVTTIAGSDQGFADGPALSAQFYYPKGITMDAAGNLFIADRTRIRKLTPGGLVTTVAGDGNFGFSDGAGSIAEFYYAQGIVVDTAGNLYIADYGNNRIRKVTF